MPREIANSKSSRQVTAADTPPQAYKLHALLHNERHAGAHPRDVNLDLVPQGLPLLAVVGGFPVLRNEPTIFRPLPLQRQLPPRRIRWQVALCGHGRAQDASLLTGVLDSYRFMVSFRSMLSDMVTDFPQRERSASDIGYGEETQSAETQQQYSRPTAPQ
jgi:hypothetical protein